jgi:hypothetical protein
MVKVLSTLLTNVPVISIAADGLYSRVRTAEKEGIAAHIPQAERLGRESASRVQMDITGSWWSLSRSIRISKMVMLTGGMDPRYCYC